MAANEPDMTLLGELYEEIDRHPPAIMARKLLVEQFIAAGWMESVCDAVEELFLLDGNDEQVKSWHTAFCTPKPRPTPAATTNGKSIARISSGVKPAKLPTKEADLVTEKINMVTSYRLFESKARLLLRNLKLLQIVQMDKGVGVDTKQREELEALANGKIASVLRAQNSDAFANRPATSTPETGRAVAQKMKNDPTNAFVVVMGDLEMMTSWLKTIWQKPVPPTEDDIRDLILRRVRMIVSFLSSDLALHVNNAFMHLEHEQFKRRYVNEETMYGDTIAEIPRENFLATEDNYAWNMEELAAAIQSNNGVMRNPLTKFMFTPADIKAIIRHPRGESLAALGLEQSELKRGVRDRTIEELDRVAQVLLADMDESAKTSREALDEFMAYLATLPQDEQKSIENLRVPAKDSHTGQAFDGSIGDTLRDAISNKLCFHKAGDFVRQAARYLRNY